MLILNGKHHVLVKSVTPFIDDVATYLIRNLVLYIANTKLWSYSCSWPIFVVVVVYCRSNTLLRSYVLLMADYPIFCYVPISLIIFSETHWNWRIIYTMKALFDGFIALLYELIFSRKCPINSVHMQNVDSSLIFHQDLSHR